MEITNELLDKYAHGQCTPEEILAVEAWLADPGTETSLPVEGILRDGEIIWDSVQKEIFEPEKQNVRPLKYSNAARWLAAASIVIVCGLAFLFSEKSPVNNNKQSYASGYTIFKTKPGERKRVRLKDGTFITLNADSQLRIPVNFTDSVRIIVLEGEAYLEVAKDPLHPFIVNTAEASVRVLGTKFNVKAYRDEKTTTVVVCEGKVRFSARSVAEKLILTQNERGRFNRLSGLREDNVYADRYLAWLDNRLIFNNEDISDIARIVERWYGIKIDLPSHIGKERFTGEFQNQSAKYVIEKICYVMDYQYEIKDRRVRIYKCR